jgi:hypothetical protein
MNNMNKEIEILRRMDILISHLISAVENGEIELGYLRKSSDEITKLIDEYEKE